MVNKYEESETVYIVEATIGLTSLYLSKNVWNDCLFVLYHSCFTNSFQMMVVYLPLDILFI